VQKVGRKGLVGLKQTLLVVTEVSLDVCIIVAIAKLVLYLQRKTQSVRADMQNHCIPKHCICIFTVVPGSACLMFESAYDSVHIGLRLQFREQMA
jgi:hypothetical protein